jgi:peptide-methionine (S)-S-oxide reductase
MSDLPKTEVKVPPGKEVATFGAGCFWCVEAIFQKLKGVDTVISGFSGGHLPHPSYHEVVSGTTGHAEVVQIIFDPLQISFNELLDVFWLTHDPTTLNRQGADVGPQYRSVVFCHNEDQKIKALEKKEKLEIENTFNQPIVTEITDFSSFYPAEAYHFNYFQMNENQPYCQFVIRPKFEKFKKRFGLKLKEE